ncbi:hypothetical protein PCH_Pc24g02800 [Penicillium rubens Wisconsin 54-1255]|uniref:Uncharacterized protein n=1 Tax=Penicillium rubens (strain ATCC 28089 / DSM 1075 / NRRL 1951 / Wisconsin 54-1255) TaxID=500485 RepID=B6HX50_PENRW|nr:hypothetical protein PCH_Pc24g02800 [Penicillium rubens Wisconsin 54-1255]
MNMVGKVDEPSTRSPEERSLVAWPAPPQVKDSTAARQQTICHWRKASVRRSSASTGHMAGGTTGAADQSLEPVFPEDPGSRRRRVQIPSFEMITAVNPFRSFFALRGWNRQMLPQL